MDCSNFCVQLQTQREIIDYLVTSVPVVKFEIISDVNFALPAATIWAIISVLSCVLSRLLRDGKGLDIIKKPMSEVKISLY